MPSPPRSALAARPPLRDVPVIAPCPRCRAVLRTRVSFTDGAPTARLDCPWCRRRVIVRAPR